MACQDKEVFDIVSAIPTISVFPWYGINSVIGGNEQDTFWHSIQISPGCCFRWKQCLIHSFAIRYRVIYWLRRPLVAWKERRQIKRVGRLIITSDENLSSGLTC